MASLAELLGTLNSFSTVTLSYPIYDTAHETTHRYCSSFIALTTKPDSSMNTTYDQVESELSCLRNSRFQSDQIVQSLLLP
jgi:hypothetical protein